MYKSQILPSNTDDLSIMGSLGRQFLFCRFRVICFLALRQLLYNVYITRKLYNVYMYVSI